MRAGEIAQVLKARVTDTNKACQVLALDIVSRIALGMNKPFEKHIKHFSSAVASVLADQKANIRASAVNTLGDIATACGGVDPLIQGLSSAVETQNPMLRSSLFSWLSQWLVDNPPQHRVDLTSMLSTIISCLDDRNADVRKGAQNMVPHVIKTLGYEKVAAEANSLKPASRSAVLLVLTSFKPVPSSVSKVTDDGNMVSRAVSRATPEDATAKIGIAPTNTSAAPKPSSRLGNMRGRKILTTAKTLDPTDGQMQDIPIPPTIETLPSVEKPNFQSYSNDLPPCPFIGSNLETKRARLTKDLNRWVIEGSPIRKEIIEVLHGQMDGRVSPHLVGLLFSSDHNAVNDFIAGMNNIVDSYNNAAGTSGKAVMGSTKAILLANSDLALKYASIRVHEPQSNLVSKCLDVLEAVLSFFKSYDQQLSDAEASSFVPTLIFKVGSGFTSQIRCLVFAAW